MRILIILILINFFLFKESSELNAQNKLSLLSTHHQLSNILNEINPQIKNSTTIEVDTLMSFSHSHAQGHHHEVSAKDLKSLKDADYLLLPPAGLLGNMPKLPLKNGQLIFSLERKNYALNEHFWLDPKILCWAKVDLMEKLQAWKIVPALDLKTLRSRFCLKEDELQKKLDLVTEFINKNPETKEKFLFILPHGAFNPLLESLNLKTYQVNQQNLEQQEEHHHHHGELTSLQLKKLKLKITEFSKISPKNKIIWIVETSSPHLKMISQMKGATDLEIKIDPEGILGESPSRPLEKFLEELTKLLGIPVP
jgi:hypothetical protein